MEMEISIFVRNFLWAFVILGVAHLVSILIFKKYKQLISLIHTLLLLILTQYFIIAQRDYIFDKYPTVAYLTIAFALLGYYIFFRDLNSFIKTKKSERDATAKDI